MKKQNQNGSALIVIVVIVAVAILAALGFVLWQHLQPKTTTPSTSKSQITPPQTVQLKEAQVDSSFPAPLSWSYPETWSITSTKQGTIAVGDTGEQTFTLTSPSGNITVSYLIGIGGGRGGTCQASENGTIQSIRNEPISGFSKGRFIEYIGDTYDPTNGSKKFTGYFYRTDIYPNNESVQNAVVGSSVCVVGFPGVTLNTDSNYVLLGATIDIKNIDAKEGESIQNIDSIKNAFSSEEYKDAVNILLSTKYTAQ